jgi:hypothetical protein
MAVTGSCNSRLYHGLFAQGRIARVREALETLMIGAGFSICLRVVWLE